MVYWYFLIHQKLADIGPGGREAENKNYSVAPLWVCVVWIVDYGIQPVYSPWLEMLEMLCVMQLVGSHVV